jgi:DNA-binding transcriptional LysR family regulator
MIVMDIEKMRSVLAVAKAHSFSEAAFDTSLSQSSVTKHVLSVEAELGVTIFTRSNTSKSVQLTSDGKIFIRYAQEISELYQKMYNQLKKLPSDKKTPMVVNMIPMPGTFNYSSILSTFFYKNPEISLTLVQKYTPDVLSALLNKEIDAAIFRPIFAGGVVLPPDSWFYDARIDIFDICDNPAFVAAGETHRLADRSSLTLKDIKNENILVQRPISSGSRSYSSVRYELFVQSCVNEGFEPKIFSNIDSHGVLQGETNLNLVAKGVGIMLINAKMPNNISGIRLIPLLGLTWEAKTAVAALKDHRVKLVEKLISCLREMASEN